MNRLKKIILHKDIAPVFFVFLVFEGLTLFFFSSVKIAMYAGLALSIITSFSFGLRQVEFIAGSPTILRWGMFIFTLLSCSVSLMYFNTFAGPIFSGELLYGICGGLSACVAGFLSLPIMFKEGGGG